MDLRANTAVDVLIGPFVDITDGNTTEDSLTLTAAEIKLSKNGQALTLKSDVTAAAFDDDGCYNCELDATDTNTEGILVLIVHQSANALPVRHNYNVLSEAAWDSLYAPKDTGFMDVNVTAWNDVLLGTTNPLPNAAADAAGGLPISDAGGLDLDTILDVAVSSVGGVPAIVTGTADSGTTTTMVDEARDEADTDYWNGCVIEFTSGNIIGQCRAITGFTVGSPATITFSPAVTNAVGTNTYRILQGADASVTGTVSADVVSINSISASAVTDVKAVQGLTTADTIATYTGNTKQTGDAFALIGTAGAGLTDLPDQTMNITGDLIGNVTGSVASVENLAIGAGGISVVASGFVKSSTEPETNSYTDTATDGTIHIVEDVAGATDFYYEFNIGSSGVPQSVEWTGYVSSQGDSYTASFYNWGTTSWDQVKTLPALNGTAETSETFTATTSHVGTGANLGLVRLRFLSADGTAVGTNRILCVYTQALTGIVNGSSVTLTSATTNTNLIGRNWSLALGGQSVDGSFVEGATVTGNGVGTSAEFNECMIGSVSLNLSELTFYRCGIGAGGSLSFAADGAFRFIDCYSDVAGSDAPVVDFGSPGATTTCEFRRWSGGLTLNGLDSSCTVSVDAVSGGTITVNGTGGTVVIRGMVNVVDGSGGAVTITSSSVINQSTVSTHSANDVWQVESDSLWNSATVVGSIVETNLDAAVSGASTHDAAAVVTALGTGSTLTGLGGMSTAMKAEVEAECLDSLVNLDLDKLMAVALPTDWATDITANSALDYLHADTNELQANQGNWLTATGFSTHDAAAVVTALGTGSTLSACATATGFSTHDAAAVVTALGTGAGLTSIVQVGTSYTYTNDTTAATEDVTIT